MKSVMMLVVVFLLGLSSLFAQKETKNFSVGFGLEGGVPAGGLKDIYNFAVGLTVRFSYKAGPGFVTLTGGALGYDPKSVEGQPKKVGLQIPIKAGYKYIIEHHFFVMGEVGYSDFKSYYGYNGTLMSTTSGSLMIAPTVGVQFNAFEIGLRYDAILKSGYGGLFALRLGFNF